MRIAVPFAVLLAVACKKDGSSPATDKPKPVEQFKPLTNESDDTFKVAPFTPAGPQPPDDLSRVELNGETDAALAAKKVLLVALGDTYLAQVTGLLAALDDDGAEVWLKHPEGAFAYPVKLRDEKAWQEWIDEPVPGKLRVIQRADGLELQTNMGKLPGFDPNGPSVPVRGGRMDLPTLRKGLLRVRSRFKDALDVCFVPSMGMGLDDVFAALAANWPSADAPIFKEVCLVYPRPKARDAAR
jgi:hypothetical protein